jgi:hypothetical protein
VGRVQSAGRQAKMPKSATDSEIIFKTGIIEHGR